MSRTWNTSWPSLLKIFGCSVVLQTRWRIVVFPALARPMIRTRKRSVPLRTYRARLCCLSISSAPWNSVLERDICRRDAWDGGSEEEQDKRCSGQCIIWLCCECQGSDVTDCVEDSNHASWKTSKVEEVAVVPKARIQMEMEKRHCQLKYYISDVM